MPPVAVARKPHHLPGLAADRQCGSAREAAFGIKADGARRKLSRCLFAGEQLLGRRGRAGGLGERRQRLRIERALILRASHTGCEN